jgi:hypothetical protein
MSPQTHHTLCPVCWNTEVATYPQNGDIVVTDVFVVTHVKIASFHIVNRSAKHVGCGASSYCEVFGIHPIYTE